MFGERCCNVARDDSEKADVVMLKEMMGKRQPHLHSETHDTEKCRPPWLEEGARGQGAQTGRSPAARTRQGGDGGNPGNVD